MLRRPRHHVNPFQNRLLSICPERICFSQPGTPEAQPELQIELGCADAQFLFQLAKANPQQQFVGVEIRKPFVDDVNRRAQEQGLANVRAAFAHINVDLPRLFAGQRIRRFFINFPDPWFKNAHKNRRIVNPALAQVLTDLTLPGGEVFFQSDIWDLALDAMAVFESAGGLRNVVGDWSFLKRNPFQACSRREQQVLERTQTVWRMLYRRMA